MLGEFVSITQFTDEELARTALLDLGRTGGIGDW
jgi:hypothetical protein